MKPLGSINKRELTIAKPKAFLKANEVSTNLSKAQKQSKEFNNYLTKVDKRISSIVEKSDAKKSLEILKNKKE